MKGASSALHLSFTIVAASMVISIVVCGEGIMIFGSRSLEASLESALLCALAACATPDLAWEIPEGVDRMEHFWRAFDESSEAVCNTNQYPELVSDLHTFADECPTDEQKLACIERAFAHLGIRRRLPCLLGHGTELPELLCDFYMMERRANSYVYGFAQMVYAAYLGKLQRAVPRPASRLISCA